jgi:AP endonuclease 1
MPRTSPRKQQRAQAQTPTSVARSGINGASSKVKTEATKANVKRKAAADDEDDDGDFHSAAEEKENIKPAKKAKTAKAKGKSGDDMKLADRTAISSLAKAMYIGAHVSAAGGKYHKLPKYQIYTISYPCLT